jgi:hypothetical protein
MAEVMVVVDGAQIETTVLYQGCGFLKVGSVSQTPRLMIPGSSLTFMATAVGLKTASFATPNSFKL